MDEAKLSLRAQHPEQRQRFLKSRKSVIRWTLVAVLLLIYVAAPSGTRLVTRSFTGSWLWQHTLAQHPRIQFFVLGSMLEAFGLWGFSIDRKPYWFFERKGIEPFWGFAVRTREIVFDGFCVLGGIACFLRALTL